MATNVKVTSANYCLPDLDEAGNIVRSGYWIATVVTEGAGGTLSATDRYDLPAGADTSDILAVVKARAEKSPGVSTIPGLAAVTATKGTKLDVSASAKEQAYIDAVKAEAAQRAADIAEAQAKADAEAAAVSG